MDVTRYPDIPVVGAPPPDTPLTVQIISPRAALWTRVSPRGPHVPDSSKLIFRVASIKWATVDSQGRGANTVRGRGSIFTLFVFVSSFEKCSKGPEFNGLRLTPLSC